MEGNIVQGPEFVELPESDGYFLLILVAGCTKGLLSLEFLADSVLPEFVLLCLLLLEKVLLKAVFSFEFAQGFILRDVVFDFRDAFEQFLVGFA